MQQTIWRQQPPASCDTQAHDTVMRTLLELSQSVGRVASKIDSLDTSDREIKASLQDEARGIRKAIDGLAGELRDELDDLDMRHASLKDEVAAIRQILSERDAELRGIKRALGWGATLLSGAGVLFGWCLTKFGSLILYSLGLGGSGGK